MRIIGSWIWSGLLFLGLVSVLIPFLPLMPGKTFDDSWQLALNQALAQGLIFGKDIFFTFGPLSSVYTWTYHPGTDAVVLMFSAYLAIAFWWGLSQLLADVPGKLKILWLFFICGFCGLGSTRFATYPLTPDAFFFSYPLIVGIYIIKNQLDDNTLKKRKVVSFLDIFVLFPLFGILPIIKASNLIMVIGTLILICGSLAISGKWKHSLLVPITVLFGFWLSSELLNQPITYLFEFLRSSLSLSSSYTLTMMTDYGVRLHPEIYLWGSVTLLVFLVRETSLRVSGKVAVFLLFTLYLFLSFKAGFTRSDERHNAIAGQALLIASMVFMFVSQTQRAKDVSGLVFFLGLVIFWEIVSPNLPKHIQSNFSALKKGLLMRIFDQKKLQEDYAGILKALKKDAGIPLISGSTDIFSWGQIHLIASENLWVPRPIFQSYAVLNAALGEKNQNFLRGDQAPQNILFKIEPIDGRLPALEDALSWPVLFYRYECLGLEKEFLRLNKRSSVSADSPPRMELKKHEAKLNEAIRTPTQKKPLYAQIKASLSWTGKLENIFYKPQPLMIQVYLEDGSQKEFRMPSEMAKMGFLISPLIETTEEFQVVVKGEPNSLKKRVSSFQVKAGGLGKSWNESIEIVFYTY